MAKQIEFYVENPPLNFFRMVKLFLGFVSPWIFKGLVLLCGIIRFSLWHWFGQGWTGWDWWAVSIGLATFCFVEWTIHSKLQHLRLSRDLILRLEQCLGHFITNVLLKAPHEHQNHHRDPGDPRDITFPVITLLYAGPLGVGFYWVLTLGRWPAIFSGLAASMASTLWLDFVHFWIHAAWRPEGMNGWSRFWRWYVCQAEDGHKLHHLKNSRRWFEITGILHLADRLFGTTGRAAWWLTMLFLVWLWFSWPFSRPRIQTVT